MKRFIIRFLLIIFCTSPVFGADTQFSPDEDITMNDLVSGFLNSQGNEDFGGSSSNLEFAPEEVEALRGLLGDIDGNVNWDDYAEENGMNEEMENPFLIESEDFDIPMNNNNAIEMQDNNITTGTISRDIESTLIQQQPVTKNRINEVPAITDEVDNDSYDDLNANDILLNYSSDFWKSEDKMNKRPFYKIQPVPWFMLNTKYLADNEHIAPVMKTADYKKLVFQSISENDIRVLNGLLDMLDINELLTESGDNILTFAVKQNNIDAVRLIISRGFDITQASLTGLNSFDLATHANQIDILNVLNEALGYIPVSK